MCNGINQRDEELIKEFNNNNLLEVRMKKANYLLYRKKLDKLGVESFIDQYERTFTSCNECIKKDCSYKNSNGCMKGETKPEILEKIKRSKK